jgi:hypothetical protein
MSLIAGLTHFFLLEESFMAASAHNLGRSKEAAQRERAASPNIQHPVA